MKDNLGERLSYKMFAVGKHNDTTCRNLFEILRLN
jgi:hypothetical protein